MDGSIRTQYSLNERFTVASSMSHLVFPLTEMAPMSTWFLASTDNLLSAEWLRNTEIVIRLPSLGGPSFKSKSKQGKQSNPVK